MFDKFEAFMNKYLTPIANKMDKQRHLSAVKKAMVAMTPLLIIGSFCLIPEAIPNMIGENNPISQWILANLDIIYIPYNVGMALMSLYVAAVISYHLAQSYKLDVPGTLSMGVIAFLMMAVDYTEDGGIMTTYLGPKGLFAAMFASIIAVELYRWCKKKNFTIKMPESVPDFVSRSFEMIPISVIVIGFFLIIRVVCVNGLHTVPPMIFTNLFAPLVGSMDNPFAVTFLQILRCLLFFFGIHPSVLSPITSPISTQFLAENMEMVKAGGKAMHFFTPGVESAFGTNPIWCTYRIKSNLLYSLRNLWWYHWYDSTLDDEFGLGKLFYLYPSICWCLLGRFLNQWRLHVNCGKRYSADSVYSDLVSILQVV